MDGPDLPAEGLTAVLSRPRYAASALTLAVVSFVTYALMLNLGLLRTLVGGGQYLLAARMVPLLTSGFIKSTTLLALGLLIVTSVLIGLNLVLAIYRLRELSVIGREGAGSIVGVVVASIAPACPACATSILAFTGVSTLFAFLPFGGTEIKVLAIMLLAGSAYYTAMKIEEDVCRTCQID